MSSDRHRYIVAVDFGTTFTGLSKIKIGSDLGLILTYYLTGVALVDSTQTSLEDIDVYRNWPGKAKGQHEIWKTPSKIAYRHENTHVRIMSSSNKDEEIWGYHITDDMDCYWWFKLRLDQDGPMTTHDDSSLASLAQTREGIMKLPAGKEPVDVCADFLRGIYNFVMSDLSRMWGAHIVEATPIDFWITHPATWSDRAKLRTKAAASRAGLGTREHDKIYMISEPEAAAVATLSKLVRPGIANQVKAGDGGKQIRLNTRLQHSPSTVLICDCGGGTVDLTTYLIKSTTPKLEFEELAVGQGAKIGSTFINRFFHSWCTVHFGHAYTEMPYKRIGPGSLFMNTFESFKRDFGDEGCREDEYSVPLVMHGVEDSPNYDRDTAMITFTQYVNSLSNDEHALTPQQ